MHKYSKLTKSLDRIAASLELQGMKALATEIDIVSNTLDASANKEAFNVGEPATMSGEYRKTVHNFVLDALETLYKTDLGSNGIVNGLLRYWMGKASDLTETTVDPTSYLQAPEVIAFSKWLKSKASEEGDAIPDKYFRQGKNDRGNTWEDLGHFMAILTTSGPEGRGKGKMDLNDFLDKEKIQDNTPKKYSPELESLFKKEAGFHEVDSPFKNSMSLIYALKGKEAPQGNFKTPNFQHNANT